MGPKSFIDTATPLLKRHMAEKGVLRNIDIAKFLDVSKATVTHILTYMEGSMGIIDHMERGTAKFYFLRGVHDEADLAAIIARKSLELSKTKTMRGSIYDSILDRFLESGHEIVEITVEGKNPISARVIIDRRIRLRGLRDKVRVEYIGGVMYLKKP